MRVFSGNLVSITFLLFLASACGGDPPGEDADAAPPTADSGNADAALCQQACTRIIGCAAVAFGGTELQVAPCAQQCALELAGNGYLDPEVARLTFTAKTKLAADASCAGSFALTEEFFASDYARLSAPQRTVIDECESAAAKSTCLTSSREGRRADCFSLYVQYAPRFRSGIETCGYPSDPCDAWSACVDRSRPPTETVNAEPWYGREFGSTM